MTDYQIAPADRNLDYYYIAKGSITEEAVGKIEWELMCWPKNQHDAGLPLDLTQAGLEKEWSNAG